MSERALLLLLVLPTLEGGRKEAATSALFHGGAKIALNAELFPSLLSCGGAFSHVVDSLVLKIFLEASPKILK